MREIKESMNVAKSFIIALALALPFAACGGSPKTKVTLEEARGAGRDRELFREGVNAIERATTIKVVFS